MNKRRVVITGLGAVTPVGNDVTSMWENMLKGTNGINKITLFDASSMRVQIAGEIKNLDIAKYLEPRQADRLDRVIILGLIAATQAYEDAKLANVEIDRYRFGTFVSSGIGGLGTIWQESQVAVARGIDRISPFFVPNSIINLVGGNIAIKYQVKGPNIPVVTACSSATNSMGEAFRYIRDGYIDLAFAGGAEAPINALGIGGFAAMKALNFTNDINLASIPFDKRRSGFVMGEGAGIMIFEEYKHAIKRGAKIYAEVIGYGATSDAFHITAPEETAEGIKKCIEFAMSDAQIAPQDIDYINAHGTGTILNDRIETRGIKRALGDAAYKVNISSTKSMTGHMLGATGAIESIAAVLAIRDGMIPPTINTTESDPDCDLNYTLGHAVKREVKVAMNINLAFGGQNAVLIFRKV